MRTDDMGDGDGTVREESPAASRVLGYLSDKLVERNDLEFICSDDVSSINATFLVVLDDADFTPTVQLRVQHCGGSWRWLKVTGTNLLADLAVGGGAKSCDISKYEVIVGQPWHQAHYDPLTGLPNRTLFMDRLQQALSERGFAPVRVFFPGPDGFTVVNNRLGHEYGDRPITVESGGSSSRLRRGDLLARFGVAEFTILPSKTINTSEVPRIAERLLPGNVCRFTLNGHTLPGSASLGAALSSPACSCLPHLLSLAAALLR
ncbi:MAG: diguanylate cyclase domain-containing protein [Thermomicrobiales bacterium]